MHTRMSIQYAHEPWYAKTGLKIYVVVILKQGPAKPLFGMTDYKIWSVEKDIKYMYLPLITRTPDPHGTCI